MGKVDNINRKIEIILRTKANVLDEKVDEVSPKLQLSLQKMFKEEKLFMCPISPTETLQTMLKDGSDRLSTPLGSVKKLSLRLCPEEHNIKKQERSRNLNSAKENADVI